MKRALLWTFAIIIGAWATLAVLTNIELFGMPFDPVVLFVGIAAGAFALFLANKARALTPPKPGRPVPRRYQEQRPWERNGPPSQ